MVLDRQAGIAGADGVDSMTVSGRATVSQDLLRETGDRIFWRPVSVFCGLGAS